MNLSHPWLWKDCVNATKVKTMELTFPLDMDPCISKKFEYECMRGKFEHNK
jgi:hypothetical protein